MVWTRRFVVAALVTAVLAAPRVGALSAPPLAAPHAEGTELEILEAYLAATDAPEVLGQHCHSWEAACGATPAEPAPTTASLTDGPQDVPTVGLAGMILVVALVAPAMWRRPSKP